MNYNDYSKELKEKLEKARLKKGQRVQFTSINNEAIALSGTSLVYDPGSKKHIPIANSKGKKEVRDESSTKDSLTVIERVPFVKENGFTQTIYGDRPDQMELFDYLLLHPANANNKKKGSVPPLGGYKFKMKDPDAEAQIELKKEEDITIAKQIVFEMEDEELMSQAKGLWPNNYQFLSTHQIKQKLIDISKQDPDKIKGLSQNVDVAGIAFVKQLEEAKVIQNKDKKWSYVDGNQKIVGITPKVDAYKTLVNFLLKEENEEVREHLKDELKKANKE